MPRVFSLKMQAAHNTYNKSVLLFIQIACGTYRKISSGIFDKANIVISHGMLVVSSDNFVIEVNKTI